MNNYILPVIGGAIIGVAVSLMLYLNGRVTGISGIISGALRRPKGDFAWRLNFIFGLILGGIVLQDLYPEALTSNLQREIPWIVFAGLLVGFGTVMGSGCTSGHGICGISRFSLRSVVATLVFMVFGILSATSFRVLIGAE